MEQSSSEANLAWRENYRFEDFRDLYVTAVTAGAGKGRCVTAVASGRCDVCVCKRAHRLDPVCCVTNTYKESIVNGVVKYVCAGLCC